MTAPTNARPAGASPVVAPGGSNPLAVVRDPSATPDPLPTHIHIRITWMIGALTSEGHTVANHWSELPPSEKAQTLAQIKRLSRDLYQLTLDAGKGGRR